MGHSTVCRWLVWRKTGEGEAEASEGEGQPRWCCGLSVCVPLIHMLKS